MSDLYDRAANYPHTLHGNLAARQCRDLIRQGISARAITWRVSRGRMVRTSRDAYLASNAGPDLLSAGLDLLSAGPDLLDRLHATMLVLPPDAVFGYHTAAALQGFGILPAQAIHVVVPAGSPVPQRRGVVVHESVLSFGKPELALGVPCTPPVRTAADLARTARRMDALPVLDAGLRVGAFSPDELAVEVARHGGLRGVRQVRALVPLADPRPECRQESQVRLLLYEAGLKGFAPQVEVRDEYGVLVCRIDLADESAKVGLEYDGASHLTRHRAQADRRRHNWLASQGWAVRYFTDADLYARPDQLVRTAADALGTTLRRPRRPRGPHALIKEKLT